ncbi:MAG: thiamine-phosphate kinase [Candidatus Firestonebacteria bacterium]
MKSMKELGEFGLIEKIRRSMRRNNNILVNIGDDTAVIKSDKSKLLLLTTDMLVEDIHFTLKHTNPIELGMKSIAVNLSDIAAMGGIPKYILVSVGIPKSLPIKFIDGMHRGMKKMAKKYNVHIVGGDTVESPKALVINIALTGEVEPHNFITRSGAKIGDAILVTGSLGYVSAKLQFLRRTIVPIPRVREAREIAKIRGANAMIDVSDGLSSDLGHILEESKVGARLFADKIPVSRETISLCKGSNKKPLWFALNGGEDYELLWTSPMNKVNEVIKRVQKHTGTKATVIGVILKKECGNAIVYSTGKIEKLNKSGYEHFK